MKIVIWHGYLLGGTGSNVYTRSLARAWRRLGHDVVVICQDPHPLDHDLLGARVVRPDIGPLLPVFVLDRYEGVEARRVGDMTDAELDRVVQANAAAVRAELPADLVLVNHLLLGAPVGAAAGAPFVVKAHGSELEYAMRGDPRLCAWAREALAPARAVVAGSQHVARVIADVLGPGPAPRPRRRRAAGRRRSTASAPSRATPPSANWLPNHATTRRTRRAAGTTSGGPTRATPSDWPGSSPATPRRSSTSASSAARRASTCCSRRFAASTPAPSSPASAPSASGSSAAPTAGCCSRARSSTATSPTCGRWPTSAWRRRSSPRRSAWSPPRPPPAARRRSWRGTRAWPRWPPASRPSTRRGSRGLGVVRARSTPSDLAATLGAILALGPADRAELGAAARRAAVRLWSWEGVAEALVRAGSPPGSG